MNDLIDLPRVLAIHDICGYGKCSLAVVMPVVSACGVEVCPLPTAVFSTNTNFKNFQMVDFTEHMQKFSSHWKEINLNFDAIYSGFLGSAEQIEYIKNIKKEFNPKYTIIDPVMGDNGVIYKTYTEEMRDNMRSLVEVSDIAIPNLTESCILANEDFNNVDTSEKGMETIARKISNLGAKNVIITGIERGDKLYNCILTKEGYTEREVNLLPYRMHGTGDLFSSVFVGNFLSGNSIIQSINKAASFVIKVMEYTKKVNGSDERGPCFETLLAELTKKI